jgi:hypothetical protein
MSEFAVPTHLADWIQDHVRRYLESAGEDGHMWDSSVRGGPGFVPTLLLVTKGRRSGNLQTLPLIYGETEGGYVIIASRGAGCPPGGLGSDRSRTFSCDGAHGKWRGA